MSDVQPEPDRAPDPVATGLARPSPTTDPVGLAAPTIPTPPDAAEAHVVAKRPRAGEMTTAWRTATVIAWAGAFLAYMAVWKASREIGIATWWLGARSSPQPIVVQILPFVVIVVFVVLASYNVRRFPLISLGGSAGLAVIAAIDLSRSSGLAAIEFAIAGAVALVSLAALTGMYRSAER